MGHIRTNQFELDYAEDGYPYGISIMVCGTTIHFTHKALDMLIASLEKARRVIRKDLMEQDKSDLKEG